jgi:spoIIIJ-associated protein
MMVDNRTAHEVIALTVEEAIEQGLDELGLSVDDVEIETIDEGSKGFLGLGSKLAKIIIYYNKPVDEKAEVKKPARKVTEKPETVAKKPAKSSARKPQLSTSEEPELQTSRETVSELLEKMGISAQVTATFLDDDPNHGEGVLVEITGKDLSILIGRRSETLNALQYIASLIVGKRLEKWVPLTIDVEGFRDRRERQLKQLALRMAEQAITTGRRQMLEPMPANERRIIHLALRDHPQVVTESTGEEPNRKLTIIPKK